MRIAKTFTIATEAVSLHPIVFEELTEDSSIFTWPSAELLSAYLAANPDVVSGKHCVELGAGTGLVSMVAALCKAAHVTITDRPGEDTLYELLQAAVSANEVQSTCSLQSLSWDEAVPVDLVCDVLLGADVFYNTEDFEALVQIISVVLVRNPRAVALIAYQERRSVPSMHLLFSS